MSPGAKGGRGLSPLALALVLLGGCGEPAREAARQQAAAGLPPIVLISIDTLRSDRLPAYGYDGVDTPAIDRLRRDSVLFERAYSPVPLTLPAHATLLTGLDPPEHGVRLNMGYRVKAEELPWLPSALRRKGYRTGAAVSSYVLRSGTGMAVDFEFFEDSIQASEDARAPAQRSGPDTLAATLPWLRSVASEPFFLLFHLYEPHAPYDPAEPYASRGRDTYDGEVAEVDAVVGELLDELERLGAYERSLILLTSDHGEGLGDHLEDEHGIFLYREALQVPLLVKLPGGERAGERIEIPAHLIDLAPTLLELVGASAPRELPGRSLLAGPDPAAGERLLYAESFYPRIYFGWSELLSLVGERYQYIHSPEPELYDLVADPGQRRNLWPADGEAAAPFRRRLAGLEPAFEEPGETDLETRRRLEALGYIGMARGPSEGPLPSPRSQAEILPRLKSAVRAAAAGRHADAVTGYREVLAENERMLFIWPLLARSLAAQGQEDAAFEAYERALALPDAAFTVALEAGRLALRLRRLETAATWAERALPAHPAAANRLLAQVALARKDHPEVVARAAAALAMDPDDAVSHLLLAQAQRAQGDLAAALASTERAEAARRGEPLRALYLLKGNLLAALGRSGEAETALRRETEAFPDSASAHARLAALLVEVGRVEEAVAVLRRFAEAQSTELAYAQAVRTLAALGQGPAARGLLEEGLRRFPDGRLLGSLSTLFE